MKINDWLNYANKTLQGSSSPKIDSEVLLSYVLGKSRAWIIAFSDTIITAKKLIKLNKLLIKRAQGQPIAYLLGTREFWSLPFIVNNSTIIPRPETELLVELSLDNISSYASNLLDLGTGCGAIALAIKYERPDCIVIGVDIVFEAIKLAKNNAKRLNIPAYFLQSNWFDNLPKFKFDLIISNPPYINSNDKHLSQGDVRFEPYSALVAKENGLFNLHNIIIQAYKWLKLGGWLLVEHGYNQGKQVNYMFRQYGYINVTTKSDYSGYLRVTLGKKTK